MALMQITIIPLGTSTPSVGPYVAAVQKMLAEQPLKYELTDMGTLIHGEADELFRLAASIHQLPFLRGAKRVVTHITMDDRRDKQRAIGDKRRAVHDLLSKEQS
jgi:uncharacterized protein (TIGR00106 family)